MLCGSSRMAKRGARSSTMRRSCSSSSPVISACSGALKPSAAAFSGTSATMPSVTKIAPAICSGGTSSTSLVSSEKSAVPSPSGRSAARTSRSSKPPSACEPLLQRGDRRLASAPVRSPRLWLALSSTTSATMPGSAFALLALQHRVGQRQHEERRGERPQRRAAHALPGEHREHDEEQAGRASAISGHGSSGSKAR